MVNGSNGMNNNNNNNSSSQSLASKQRLRWTHELHERFVDAVAQLGGPDSESLSSSSSSSLKSCLFLSASYVKNLWEDQRLCMLLRGI